MLDGEILVDISSTGKERPWQRHKSSSILLAESYHRLGFENKSARVQECGSMLKFNECPSGHEKRLSWANFCRIRLCPMCSWRKSLLNAHQLKLIAHESVKRKKMRWLFLTLTVRNCESDELSREIDNMMNAFSKLRRRKQFKENVIGWFRAFEVTRNNDVSSEWYGTYHPHFHVLLGVSPSYFGRDYMQQEEWISIWKECLNVDYKPVVDIRAVKNKKRDVLRELKILEEKGIEFKDDLLFEADLSGSAVAELSKYATKSSDYIIPDDEEKTDEIVLTLEKSLFKRRFHAYGGLLKDVYVDLIKNGKIADSEDDKADLVHIDDETDKCKCSVCGSDMLEELYSWIPSQKNYIKREKSPNQND